MRLYHVTTEKAAKLIQKQGFKDGIDYYGLLDSKTFKPHVVKGIWFSNLIFDSVKYGVSAVETTCVFVVDLPENAISGFEVITKEGSYRELIIPAKIVNRYFTKRTIYSIDDELLYPKLKILFPFPKQR